MCAERGGCLQSTHHSQASLPTALSRSVNEGLVYLAVVFGFACPANAQRDREERPRMSHTEDWVEFHIPAEADALWVRYRKRPRFLADANIPTELVQ